MTVTDEIGIHNEVRRRLSSGNVCYSSVQNHFIFSRRSSKYVKP